MVRSVKRAFNCASLTMSARQKNTALEEIPHVVGTIHSAGALRRALKLRPGAVDFLEVRADHFAADPTRIAKALSDLPAPFILTVRHPAEGGAGGLLTAQRHRLFEQFLPQARFIDLEVRSIGSLAGLLAEAQKRGIRTIVSDHHFHSTPSLARLRKRLVRARQAGADIAKVAALTSSAADLSRLLALFAEKHRPSLSVMGMGRLGKVSRLLFAGVGSVLNYGYLDQPQVPGQWEATELKLRLAEISAEA